MEEQAGSEIRYVGRVVVRLRFVSTRLNAFEVVTHARAECWTFGRKAHRTSVGGSGVQSYVSRSRIECYPQEKQDARVCV